MMPEVTARSPRRRLEVVTLWSPWGRLEVVTLRSASSDVEVALESAWSCPVIPRSPWTQVGGVVRWPSWIVARSLVVARCEFCARSGLELWCGDHFGSLRGPSLRRCASFCVQSVPPAVVKCLRLITDSFCSLAHCWRSMLKLWGAVTSGAQWRRTCVKRRGPS